MPTCKPAWAQASINRAFDVARPQAGDGFRFETVKKVNGLRKILKPRLKQASGGAIRLTPCKKDDRCNCAACPICTRNFRRFASGQALELASRAKHSCVLTVHLEDVPQGKLVASHLPAAKARLRTWLDRAGFKGALLIGGIEVDWRARDGVSRIHAHLLVIGASEPSFDRLRESHNSASNIKVRVDRLEKPRKQISYNMKFGDAHRPGARTGQLRSRPVPMRGAELVERVLFYQGNPIESFLFLYGCRRCGTKIERTGK